MAAAPIARPMKEKYTGERKNQLRHGYGIYNYKNKFFRYEGQWENGLKHGHGKLILGDGGYYEGTFVNGEMEGHGYRVFGLTGVTYSGQFSNGEMHGQGLMRRPNGEQYEGTFVHGKKEGTGIYTGSDGSVYEGSFNDNKMHGEGLLMYSNGDQYEGGFVAGRRHGCGLLRCGDGTIYDGQWRGDVYHGQGSISHSSGVTYNGMWINGRPAWEPAKLRLSDGCAGVNVEQGKTFTVKFEVIDAKGEVITQESGRSFKVVASMRKTIRRQASKRLSAMPSTMNIQKHPSIHTPYGYSVLPYELLQIPKPEGSSSTTPALDSDVSKLNVGAVAPIASTEAIPIPSHKSNLGVTFSKGDNKIKIINEEDSQLGRDDVDKLKASASTVGIDDSQDTQIASVRASSSTFQLHAATFTPSEFKRHSGSLAVGLSTENSRSLVFNKDSDTDESKMSKEERFLAGLVTPAHIHTVSGQGMAGDLYLPPPPIPDISHILAPSPSKISLSPSPSSSDLALSSSSKSNEGKKSPSSSSRSGTPTHASKTSPRSPSRKKLTAQGSVNKMRKSDEKLKKLFQPKRERFCHTGTYVLIISEVTDPPFLGSVLPDLFVEVTVSPQKTNSREVSLDKLVRSKSKLKK